MVSSLLLPLLLLGQHPSLASAFDDGPSSSKAFVSVPAKSPALAPLILDLKPGPSLEDQATIRRLQERVAALELALAMAQSKVTPPTPPAAPPQNWMRQDNAGQWWSSPDRAYLDNYIATRNQELSRASTYRR